MQFTEKYINALKAKETRYDLRENSGDGFGIRVATSGEKSWIFFYTYESRKRRMTLGNYPNLSLSEARQKHRDALNTLAHGRDPGLIKQQEKTQSGSAATVEG